jgi:hypothetical protein
LIERINTQTPAGACGSKFPHEKLRAKVVNVV